MKQNRYPVMFNCMESSSIDSAYWDRRTRTLGLATNFAHSQQLLVYFIYSNIVLTCLPLIC